MKDTSALISTRGRHLKAFTPEEIDGMRTYNIADKDAPGKPLNKKPLPYNKVKAFIATQLGK